MDGQVGAPKFRETDEFLRGRAGEHVVSRELRRRGYYVIPSYDYVGEEEKAPRMQGRDRGHILPDLDVSHPDKKRVWVEVKTKKHSVVFRKTGDERHGINRAHWAAYKEVERITGCKVWLCFHEESTGNVYCCALDAAMEQEYIFRKNGQDRKPMIWFSKSKMKLLFRIVT